MTDEEKQTIRETIVEALKEGFGDDFLKTEVYPLHTYVFTKGSDVPIKVEPLDVSIPDTYSPEVIAGIRLDVQTIVANLENE